MNDDALPVTWDRAGLEFSGFEGFVPLVGLDMTTVPNGHGLYIVLRGGSGQPVIVEDNPISRKGLKLYSVEYLTKFWVAESSALYIGKAAGVAGLNDRLRAYSKKSKGHSGGRAIWQLADSGELLVSWKELENAPAEEQRYLRAFRAAHGDRRPFANRNGGGTGRKRRRSAHSS